jgi:hypothetical protein
MMKKMMQKNKETILINFCQREEIQLLIKVEDRQVEHLSLDIMTFLISKEEGVIIENLSIKSSLRVASFHRLLHNMEVMPHQCHQ